MGTVLFGIVGASAALLIAGAWSGAALLLGFAPPTGDQVAGLLLLLGCGGLITGGVLTVIWS